MNVNEAFSIPDTKQSTSISSSEMVFLSPFLYSFFLLQKTRFIVFWKQHIQQSRSSHMGFETHPFVEESKHGYILLIPLCEEGGLSIKGY